MFSLKKDAKNVNNLAENVNKITINEESKPDNDQQQKPKQTLQSKLKLGNKLHINLINANAKPELPTPQENEQLSKKYNKMINSLVSESETSSVNDKEPKKKFHLSLYNLKKIGRLGGGASGEVFLIQDVETKKLLALKTVQYSSEEKVQKQLETEVKLNSELKSDYTIRCYAAYFNEGTINFVLEYMDRGTLDDALKKAKKIPENILGIITCQVIKGLAYIQTETKIIHRDLKPSNILLKSKGYAKISDFGVSAMVQGSWEQKKTMVGTYLYMAPERIDADIYYLNSDIWSLGMIVLECCLGFFPYKIYNNNQDFPNLWKVREAIENKPVPSAGEGYSEEINDFIQKCLNKKIEERPKAIQLLNHPFIKKYEGKSCKELAEWLKTLYPNGK